VTDTKQDDYTGNRSSYVPEFKTDEERLAWKEKMLDELAWHVKSGALRPVTTKKKKKK
jgi:FPC/CPF motif-containing protein YcgG